MGSEQFWKVTEGTESFSDVLVCSENAMEPLRIPKNPWESSRTFYTTREYPWSPQNALQLIKLRNLRERPKTHLNDT